MLVIILVHNSTTIQHYRKIFETYKYIIQHWKIISVHINTFLYNTTAANIYTQVYKQVTLNFYNNL